MHYERPAIERRVELASPVINGVIFFSGPSPTWRRPWPTNDPGAPPAEPPPR